MTFAPAFRCLSVGLALAVSSVGILSRQAAADAPVDHPIVPGFERIFTASGEQPAASNDTASGGLLLVGELNCTSCHEAGKAWKSEINNKTAPVLDKIGARVRPDYLRRFLANPQHVKPGTTMPNLFASLPPAEAAAQVEALAQFLSTTGSLTEEQPKGDSAKRGERLFHTIGCIACHAPRRDGAGPVTAAVPLGDLGAKYSLASLAEFLTDPHKTRSGGRMPALSLKKEEAIDLAAYLTQVAGPGTPGGKKPELKYTTYHGQWAKLPNFSELKPVRSGTVQGLNLGVAQRDNGYAIRFEGFLQIPRNAEYKFHVGSDDASRIVVDGTTAALCDGIHPFEWSTGIVRLTAGVHPVAIEFFQEGGGAELQADIESPEMPRQPLLNFVSLEKESAVPAEKAAEGKPAALDIELVSKGKELFGKIGCASCHQLKHGAQTVASTLEANPLASFKEEVLAAKSGCLSETPAAGRPHYSLNARQRECLTAALGLTAKPQPPVLTPEQLVQRTLTTFNCYACHVRGGLGGVEEARNEYFETTQKEMGDEGRLPPPLNGVGDKMNLDYIRRIFANGGEDRPYMLTRMPKFGQAQLGKLADTFAQLDIKGPDAAPPELTGQPSRFKADARMLVGERGLGCIKCHDFGKLPSTGIRAMSLTKLHARLRHDWFDRYLLDPQSLRPGTRMPAAWPNGQTFFKNVLGGDAAHQVEGVWAYLADGDKAAVPAGVTPKSMEVAPDKETVMYRNFIEGAGPRAIGVGYPEKANLAFDAENLRLALIWHGAFIDASRHWTGRGEGYQPPAGDHVLPLAKEAPLANLADSQASWPAAPAREQVYRFLGYRLSKDQRPTFRYKFGTVMVEETPAPLVVEGKPNEPTIRRTLELSAPAAVADLWFLAAKGTAIEALPDGRYQVDHDWKTRVAAGDASPVVRKAADGKFELLLPVRFTNNRATVTQDFEW